MATTEVTIIGGGIAGLTAAWELAERGYAVKLFEMKDEFGGDLGSVRDNQGLAAAKRGADLDIDHDVYPHMYLPSYRNFFAMVEEVTGKPREDNFEQITNVKQLTEGEFPEYKQLTNTFSVNYLLENLLSGVLTPLDMFIFGYANYDLLAESLQPTALLDKMSVNGFLHSRPYMTMPAAEAIDFWVDLVWGIKSYETSATAYQQYLASGFPDPTPALWFLRGSTYKWLIEPMTEALQAKGVELHLETGAVGVRCEDGRIVSVDIAPFTFDADSETYVAGPAETHEVQDVILAVPAPVLNTLVKNGEAGCRIIDALPELTHLGKLRQVQLPVLHLYFNRKLDHFPKEPTSFVGAKYGLAFTDISENWEGVPHFVDHTVIALSASDPMQLPGPTYQDNSVAMIKELARFVPEFTMGDAWGESDDIDWKRTHYGSNINNQLFVNDVGSNAYRPPATFDAVENLCLAGDFVDSEVGMATVETAVVGGLKAAQALVGRDGGDPVPVIPVKHWPPAVFVALRWLLGPAAYAAKFWSTVFGGYFGQTVTPGVSPIAPALTSPLAKMNPVQQHQVDELAAGEVTDADQDDDVAAGDESDPSNEDRFGSNPTADVFSVFDRFADMASGEWTDMWRYLLTPTNRLAQTRRSSPSTND